MDPEPFTFMVNGTFTFSTPGCDPSKLDLVEGEVLNGSGDADPYPLTEKGDEIQWLTRLFELPS